MKIEKVKFERTGGFAGIRIAAEIEVDELPEPQKKELLELLDELDFEKMPKKLARRVSAPDDFVYSVTVEADHQEYRVLAGESAVSDDMQPLLELLERIAKRQMRKKTG